MFAIERVRDRERKLGWNQWKGTEKIVRDREKFEIEGVRDGESPLYVYLNSCSMVIKIIITFESLLFFRNKSYRRKKCSTFFKTKKSNMATRYPDQNFKEECCGSSKHGCNVHKIYDYCPFVPVVVMSNDKKRK